MIRTLRWKVVAVNMLFVTVVLIAVLIGIYGTSRAAIAESSDERLRQILQTGQYTEEPGFPCFVAEIFASGTVRVSGSSYFDLQDEQYLLDIVNACLRQNASRGVLPDYHLRYHMQYGPITARIAFTDSTLEQAAVRSIVGNSALIGGGALLVLFAFSYILSGFVTRPVSRAWAEQHRFLSDASHELKTPLTVILSSADLLQEETDSPYVDNIRAESRRMKKLVDAMLTLSRAENDGQKIHLQPTDFSDTATGSVLRFEPVVFESGKELRYTIDEHLAVVGDSEKLTQLLGILLDNAIKYAPTGTPIDLRLQKSSKSAVLTVENCGEPIPQQKLKHLFDRFYRADESRSGAEGFGLGLSIAQTIVKAHRGSIRCESDSRSTRFIVTIPLAKA